MIYQSHRLDGRHSHNDRFRYYLSFSASMAQRSGPLHFNSAMAWCVQTWSWSAEINQTAKILSWTLAITRFPQGTLPELSEHCNASWSWSNRLGDDLRIYLRGDPELTWFQLAHPVDQ
jgi:hypothetical protein